MDLSKIQQALSDAALPVSDFKNPTEDYVVNLLTEFLSKFSINISLIDQPISEQLDVMPYYEDSDIINLINFYAVLTQILDKIFLHDFCLTDITSPGQKRLKMQAKFISNFMLYTILKKSEFNMRMEEIEATSRLLKDLRQKKDQVLQSINNKALQRGKQLSLIEKLSSDIQCIQSNTENINKKNSDLEMMKNDVKKENEEVKELYNSFKTKTEELNKVIFELQSEIVHSPEKYRSNLDKLEKLKNEKEEERITMQDAIQEKEQSIKHSEVILNVLQKIDNGVSLLKDIINELKCKKTKSDDIKKEIDSSNNILHTLQTKLAMHKDQLDTEINELQSHREEDIAPVFNLYNQHLSEKKAQKAKLDANKVCCDEKCLKRNKLRAEIMKIEKDITVFLSSCQEMYDNEIAEELKLRNGIMKTLKGERDMS